MADSLDRYLDEHRDRFVAELRELCAIPCESGADAALEAAARWCADRLGAAQAETRTLRTGAEPALVVGEAGSGKRTLICVQHYDVQPAVPLELWQTPPFDPTIRDGAVFARGVNDNKGHLLLRIQAVEAYRATRGELPIKVRFLIEGEEEDGSAHLAELLAQDASLTDGDGALKEGGGIDAAGRPHLLLGGKGIYYVELRSRTMLRDAHSGGATYLPNAAWRLIDALKTLVDKDGRILIDGFYDDVRPPTDAELGSVRALPFEADDKRRIHGIREFAWQRSEDVANLHLVRLHRHRDENGHPRRGDREGRLPPCRGSGPGADRQGAACAPGLAWLQRHRGGLERGHAPVPRAPRRSGGPGGKGRGRGRVRDGGVHRAHIRRHVADVAGLREAEARERHARDGPPRIGAARAEREHPARQLLARAPRDGRPVRAVRDAGVSVRALVFDFDGLILETETPAYQAWVEIYREYGHELPKALWLDYIGREGGWFDALAYLEGLAGPQPDRDAITRRRDERKTELVMKVAETAGLRELLTEARARHLLLAVCSSSTPKWVLGHLDRLGLRAFFDHVQCRDRSDLRAKPAPDLYLAACAGLGVRPEEAIAFEDSRNGMLAAQAAGMRCVVVPNELTIAMDLGGADHRFESLAAISLQELLGPS